MAIYKQVNNLAGKNASAIPVATPFNSRYRVRMADRQRHKFGAWNNARFVNKSGRIVRVHFTIGPAEDDFIDIPANGIRNRTTDDGQSFYAFDVANLDAGTEVAIGDFTWRVWTIQQLPESEFIQLKRRF